MQDYLSYMEGLKARAIEYGLTGHGPIEGCTEAEIQALEDKFNYPLPAAFRSYLAVMGKTPPYLFDVNTDYAYADIMLQPDEDNFPYPYLLRNSPYTKLTDDVFFFVIRGADYCYLLYKRAIESDPPVYMIYDGAHHIRQTIEEYMPRTTGYSFCQVLELIIEGRRSSLLFSLKRYPLDTIAEESWKTFNFTIPDWARLDDCYDWEHIQRLDALKPESVSPFEMEAKEELPLNILCVPPYRLVRQLQAPDTVGLTNYETYTSDLHVQVDDGTVYRFGYQKYLSLAKLMYQWLREEGPQRRLSFVKAVHNCCLTKFQQEASSLDELANDYQTINVMVLIYEEAHHGWRLYLPTYEYTSPGVFSGETLTACFQHFIDFVDKLLAWNFPQRPAVQVKHLYTKEYPEWVRLPAAEHRK